jgi:hypothetical protein
MEPMRAVFGSFSPPWGVLDDPPSATRPKGSGVRARSPLAMLRVERKEIFGVSVPLLFMTCGGHEVLIPAWPDRGKREETTIRAA